MNMKYGIRKITNLVFICIIIPFSLALLCPKSSYYS